MIEPGSEGKLIAVCGIDGAGKSSLVAAARARLDRSGVDFVSKTTKAMISLHLEGRPIDSDGRNWSAGPFAQWAAIATALDFLAHYEREIAPRLSGPNLVICDRYWPCYAAYLEATRTPISTPPWSERLSRPVLHVLVDVPVETAVRRHWERGGPTEDEVPEVLGRLRAIYLSYAARDPRSWLIVDNTRPFEESLSDLLGAIAACRSQTSDT